MNKVEISQETADCVTQHMNAFLQQCHEEKTADFGAPCATCIHVDKCNMGWYTKMRPIFDHSNVAILLRYRAHSHK